MYITILSTLFVSTWSNSTYMQAWYFCIIIYQLWQSPFFSFVYFLEYRGSALAPSRAAVSLSRKVERSIAWQTEGQNCLERVIGKCRSSKWKISSIKISNMKISNMDTVYSMPICMTKPSFKRNYVKFYEKNLGYIVQDELSKT